MLLVRDIFTAKPGQAGKLARLFREIATEFNWKARVMTDLVANMHTVVLETEIESLSAYEKEMEEYGKNPAMGEKMKGYNDMYSRGKREIYRITE